jgi:hypothetical protein
MTALGFTKTVVAPDGTEFDLPDSCWCAYHSQDRSSACNEVSKTLTAFEIGKGPILVTEVVSCTGVLVCSDSIEDDSDS